MEFEHLSFSRNLRTMLKVDFRRMFTMPLIYIMVGCCLVMPVLILVMTTMMDGTVSVDPTTGVETVVEGFKNTWQIIGSESGAGAAMGMDMTAMCNINMLYFFAAALVCIFVAEDFRSGYAKNLFTIRADKADYVISKTLVCTVGSALMLLAFFMGSMAGGAVSGLPFELGRAGVPGLVMCMIAKMLLCGVFVPIFLLCAVCAKQKLWLSLIISFVGSMLLFMMVPMISPLDSNIINIVFCLAGAVMFAIGLGAVSNRVLKTTALV